MVAVNEYRPEHAMESVITPYPYQRRFVLNDARFQIIMWSRQCGKSMGAALKVNDHILQTEADGRKTLWTVISRSLGQAREMAIKIRDVARAIEAARKIIVAPEMREIGELEERSFELQYPGGSRVVVVSGNPDSAAGFTGNVLWDEAALTKRNRELFTTAFPVVSRGTSKFIIITTPRPGWFQKKWEEAVKPDSIWSTHKLTIIEAVEQGCPQDPEMLRAALHDEMAWRQEYLCEFVDDEICWLPWELIQGCTDDRASMKLADFDGPVYAGWDIARWHNLSVLSLLGKCGNQLTTVGMIAMKRVPFERQYETVTAACKRYPGFVRLCLDAGGMGEAPNEEMKRRLGGRVEGIKFHGGMKEVLAGDLRHVMEERNLLLPDDEDLRQDLHSVRCTTTAAGNKRFEGESGDSHADRFWAKALAVHAAIAGGGPAMPIFEPVGETVWGGRW